MSFGSLTRHIRLISEHEVPLAHTGCAIGLTSFWFIIYGWCTSILQNSKTEKIKKLIPVPGSLGRSRKRVRAFFYPLFPIKIKISIARNNLCFTFNIITSSIIIIIQIWILEIVAVNFCYNFLFIRVLLAISLILDLKPTDWGTFLIIIVH